MSKTDNSVLWLLLFGGLLIYGGKKVTSYLNDLTLPRGVRNNNPGNLRVSKSPWRGKVPIQDNKDGELRDGGFVVKKSFEQFFEWHYGVRALIVLLRNYHGRGFDTITEMINRYAPPSENVTDRYIDFMERQTGFDANEKLSWNKGTASALVRAISHFENGKPVVSGSDVDKAWELV